MTFSNTNFDMGSVLNKLRAIAEDTETDAVQAQAKTARHDPEMDTSGKEIDQNSFSRTMMRLAAIKDAVGEDHYNDLRTGVRAMYMNHRPNLKQMSALMDLLETVLSYVAEDNSLFQRLKSDLNKDMQDQGQNQWPWASQDKEGGASGSAQQTTKAPEIGAPDTATPVQGMRDIKTA
jgi:hypothetical protein